MEQFLLENAERFKLLVSRFKPNAAPTKGGSEPGGSSPDILVSARVRPMLEDETDQGFPVGVYLRDGTNTLDLHELRRPVRGLPTISSFNYTVDRVFGPDATTADIYESLVKPLVPWAWGGGIGTMFAYGQTGSGKTFTVSGLEQLVAETLMDGSLDGERKIHICIIELAGQTAYDLLNSRKQISILEDSFGTTQMAGALEHQVTDKSSLLELIKAAASLRHTAPTLKNDTSSRSHAICRIRIENPLIPSAEDGLLYLIDLAGSEAARDKTDHDATRMKESREINTSLSVLKDCIRGRALADADVLGPSTNKRQGAYVPFRQSTLTKTLKHVFDPASNRSCRTVVVACVNPCAADVGASKNTLRYAEMLRVVVPKKKGVTYDPNVPATWNNEQLRSWIEKNSGNPPISASLLAPHETGPQLLRLPLSEFLTRCLKSDGVSPEQAQAFQAKFWKLHVDSSQQQRSNKKPDPASRTSTTASSNPSQTRLELLDCSADPDADSDAGVIPFKQRIRPGMVVSFDPPAEYAGFAVGGPRGKGLAVVLSPVWAVSRRVKDVRGALVNPVTEGNDDAHGAEGKGKREREDEAYLCALVMPGLLPGSYGVGLWRQVVVQVSRMEEEVLMEWDEATRYYYLTV